MNSLNHFCQRPEPGHAPKTGRVHETEHTTFTGDKLGEMVGKELVNPNHTYGICKVCGWSFCMNCVPEWFLMDDCDPMNNPAHPRQHNFRLPTVEEEERLGIKYDENHDVHLCPNCGVTECRDCNPQAWDEETCIPAALVYDSQRDKAGFIQAILTAKHLTRKP